MIFSPRVNSMAILKNPTLIKGIFKGWNLVAYI